MKHTSLLAGYRQQLEADPSKPAFILDERSFTYADLQAQVGVLQQEFGQRKHLRVAIALPNCVDLACWYIACVSSRHTLILMDPDWPEATLAAALELVQPDILIRANPFSINHYDVALAANPRWYGETNFAFLAGFTSGSSGQPKAFLRYSDSWQASFQCSASEFDVTSTSVQLAPGPLSHGLSFYALAESLHAGATFMSQTAFNASGCIKALQASSPVVDNLIVVPTMLQRLLAEFNTATESNLRLNDADTESMQFRTIVAGAKLSSRLKQHFHTTWPSARLSEYYGASELSFVSVNHDHENLPDDSVGRLCEGVSLATFDDNDEEIQGSTTGTLHVRSPMLAAGYLRVQAGIGIVPLPGRQGWCSVGDCGWLDAKGNLYLAERKDRMLISGGLNVYPSNVERVISDTLHGSKFSGNLEHCVICGIPHPEWGEQIVLILAGRGLPSRFKAESVYFKRILAECFKRSLQKSEVPKRLFLSETVPMTSSGKVAYRELQKQLPVLEDVKI